MMKNLKFNVILLVCLLSAFKVLAQESNSIKDYKKFYLKRFFFQTNTFCVHLNPIFFNGKNEIPKWSI